MNASVNLKIEDAESVNRLVASGRYASPDEVIHEAIRLVSEREEWFAMVEAQVAEGRADVAAGRVHTIEEVREHFRQRFSEDK